MKHKSFATMHSTREQTYCKPSNCIDCEDSQLLQNMTVSPLVCYIYHCLFQKVYFNACNKIMNSMSCTKVNTLLDFPPSSMSRAGLWDRLPIIVTNDLGLTFKNALICMYLKICCDIFVKFCIFFLASVVSGFIF